MEVRCQESTESKKTSLTRYWELIKVTINQATREFTEKESMILFDFVGNRAYNIYSERRKRFMGNRRLEANYIIITDIQT